MLNFLSMYLELTADAEDWNVYKTSFPLRFIQGTMK